MKRNDRNGLFGESCFKIVKRYFSSLVLLLRWFIAKGAFLLPQYIFISLFTIHNALCTKGDLRVWIHLPVIFYHHRLPPRKFDISLNKYLPEQMDGTIPPLVTWQFQEVGSSPLSAAFGCLEGQRANVLVGEDTRIRGITPDRIPWATARGQVREATFRASPAPRLRLLLGLHYKSFTVCFR